MTKGLKSHVLIRILFAGSKTLEAQRRRSGLFVLWEFSADSLGTVWTFSNWTDPVEN